MTYRGDTANHIAAYGKRDFVDILCEIAKLDSLPPTERRKVRGDLIPVASIDA